jgi:hypothetical protein
MVMKYFMLAGSRPPYSLAALAVVTIFGVGTTEITPSELDSGLGIVLLVHMFLASSGFVVSARRGHYDPVLLHGVNRTATLAAEWGAAILPGALGWGMVAMTGLAAGNPAALSALAGSRLVAFVVVSALAWAVGSVMPRGGGGVLWMGLLVLLLLNHVDVLAPGAQTSALTIARTAGAVLVCPFILLGTHAPVGVPALIAAFLSAIAILLSVWRAGPRLVLFILVR